MRSFRFVSLLLACTLTSATAFAESRRLSTWEVERIARASSLHKILQNELSRPLGLYEPLSLGASRGAEDLDLAYEISKRDPADGTVPGRGKQTALEWIALGSALPMTWELDRYASERALAISADTASARSGALARSLLCAGSILGRAKAAKELLGTLFRGSISVATDGADLLINVEGATPKDGSFSIFTDDEGGTRHRIGEESFSSERAFRFHRPETERIAILFRGRDADGKALVIGREQLLASATAAPVATPAPSADAPAATK